MKKLYASIGLMLLSTTFAGAASADPLEVIKTIHLQNPDNKIRKLQDVRLGESISPSTYDPRVLELSAVCFEGKNKVEHLANTVERIRLVVSSDDQLFRNELPNSAVISIVVESVKARAGFDFTSATERTVAAKAAGQLQKECGDYVASSLGLGAFYMHHASLRLENGVVLEDQDMEFPATVEGVKAALIKRDELLALPGQEINGGGVSTNLENALDLGCEGIEACLLKAIAATRVSRLLNQIDLDLVSTKSVFDQVTRAQ